ncbi:MAG: hypothetical protein LBL49_02625 [Clostridiales Family XIII bacterium]|jgi:hypothetical protein|nr:hypothetical protein [Clostridiales Family XIII bacterium]
MDYVHQVIDSDRLVGALDLPNTFKGRKVEVIILPVQETNALRSSEKSSFGCLQKYAHPSLANKERDAWEQAVEEKHADR